MTEQLPRVPPVMPQANILKLAIMAVGGQGGGVLTSWIEAMARAQGYVVQATSVAGVAQRTGSTIYYIEMAPRSDFQPVFSLAPSGGDVDIMIAAEMMEVGRAVMRGFVTPDRTVLIGSTHRALAVSEKTLPGNGMANAAEVRAAAEIAARRLILADMDRLATDQGSVISASLFGALAGSGSLPFARDAFEEAIRSTGKGVDASLRAFKAGFDVAQAGIEPAPALSHKALPQMEGPTSLLREWNTLSQRVADFPETARPLIQAGLEKCVDYQDCAYGALYLDRMWRVVEKDTAATGFVFTQTCAKYLANAVCYDDVIRVSDLKTRKARFERIAQEMGKRDDQVMQLTEYFHPRAEEIAGLLPKRWGMRVQSKPGAMARLERWFGQGRRLRSDGLATFIALHILSGLKGYRLKTLRHHQELTHINAWLTAAFDVVEQDYDLAVELIKNRRLIKGYSDTHARGLSKFDKVMGATARLKGRKDAADWMARLREAALQDPDGVALDGALETVKSFT